MVAIDLAKWSEDLRHLADNTSAFNDKELGVSQCVLAAAAAVGPSDFERLRIQLQGLTEGIQALKDLSQGREISLTDDADFFSLYKVARQLKIRLCSEVCQAAVAENKLEDKPIRLQFSSEQYKALQTQLSAWQQSKSSQFADATVKLRMQSQDNHEGKEKQGSQWKSLRVHAIVLAASSEYFRGLWAGGFSEAHGELQVQIEDTDDAIVAESLIRILYGETVRYDCIDELLKLFSLADKWQCQSVLSAMAPVVKDEVSVDTAIDILGRTSHLPPILLSIAMGCVTDKLNGTWEFPVQASSGVAVVQRALPPVPRRVALLDEVEAVIWRPQAKRVFRRSAIPPPSQRLPPLKMSAMAFFRVLSATKCCSTGVAEHTLSITRQELLKRIQPTSVAGLDNPEFMQATPEIMLEILEACTFKALFMKWARNGADNAGAAISRIVRCYQGSASSAVKAVLREALCTMHSGASPETICAMLQCAFESDVPKETQADGEAPTKKRRKTSSGFEGLLSKTDHASRAWFKECALSCAAPLFTQLPSCGSWLRLPPLAVVYTAAAALEESMFSDEGLMKRKVEFLKPLKEWAQGATADALFAGLEGTRSHPIRKVISGVVQARLVSAESQNAMGLDAAVAAARKEADASVRSQFSEATSKLQSELQEEKRLRQEASKKLKLSIVRLQDAMGSCLQTELGSLVAEGEA